ncbi:hypothetical protein DN730_02365 [Marinomonas piezotolerans]|uniref:Uncharacterized protein n=1 Tax=Marinomonas piezotolerans TaxID=2213058 RepID=A0A370UDY8_9GAMM|nr:hypothetical protein [Marinomonas piezotolerans]RDL45915.1 hypothetical protein DN730_02365 [Marinomonas piezotolerans]
MLWLLLEASTLLLFASFFILWRIRVLKKKQHDKDEVEVDAQPNNPNPQSTKDDVASKAQTPNETPFKSFASKLEQQAQSAADKLIALRSEDDLEEVTQYKLWGTLLKAERAIVLNDSSDRPKTILNRFMANIIGTLESVQNKRLTQSQLSKSLEEVDLEFQQASEILISKEALIENQKTLHDELQRNIDDSAAKLLKLDLKNRELIRLHNELSSLKAEIQKLETEHNSTYKVESPSSEGSTDKHHSSRHLIQLQRLSERQQAIIEHLQEQLEDKDGDDIETKEKAREAAISRMERMSNESNALIGQLQAELENTSLTINALKADINTKNQQLIALDEEIKARDGGALGGFMALHSNKQNALESLIGNLANIKSDNAIDHDFESQEQEINNLERMLKESETCVQLLAQELESAELENENLKAEAEELIKNRVTSASSTKDHYSPNSLEELNAQREINRSLVAAVSEIKEQLLSNLSNNDERQLRNEYNRKSLELDRLQLAYSDLERKYLGTLRQDTSS